MSALHVLTDCRHLPAASRLAAGSGRPAVAGRAAIFLDRDGVLIEDVHYLRSPRDIRVFPGVPEALRQLAEQFYLVVVTNQSGIARGYLSEADLADIHEEMLKQFAAQGAWVDVLYYCPHLPEAPLAEYRRICACRKPLPGMVNRAAADWDLDVANSYLVGDMPRDIDAARAAGVTGILLDDGRRAGPQIPFIASDLLTAAHLILERSNSIAGTRSEATAAPPGTAWPGKEQFSA